MVATAKRKAERAKVHAEAQAKSRAQAEKNASKKRKSSKSQQQQPLPSTSSPKSKSKSSPQEDTTTEPPTQNPDTNADSAPATKHRFILFIGNLPFSATTPQIEQHFASVRPISVRHSTDKQTGKSKGFAFLEFDDYSRMTACIKSFHHSLFAPVVKEGKAEEGRKINVELTVGGGGSKSEARKSKLRAKNEKLSRERRKRAAPAGKDKAETKEEAGGEDMENHIHPSRRGKVTG